MAFPAHFTYSILERRHESIRLLTIEPGRYEDDLQATISVFGIDELPSYEALSYVWGSNDNDALSLYRVKGIERFYQSHVTSIWLSVAYGCRLSAAAFGLMPCASMSSDDKIHAAVSFGIGESLLPITSRGRVLIFRQSSTSVVQSYTAKRR